MDIYRVTVRGHFGDLTEGARTYLLSAAEDHDIFLSKFTEEGTFTYDQQLHAFNLRYEVRIGPDAKQTTAEDPAAIALREAQLFLRTMRITHGPLRVAVMDMTDMTKRQPQRRTKRR